MSSLVRITEMWRLPGADGTGAEYHVVVHGDDDEVTPCRIAGWMPWLPPTPAPTMGPVRLRDETRALIGVEDPELSEMRGKHMAKPWRSVLSYKYTTVKDQYELTLECGHIVIRWHHVDKTTCSHCPRVMR